MQILKVRPRKGASAMRFTSHLGTNELHLFLEGTGVQLVEVVRWKRELRLRYQATLGGDMIAREGDWLVKVEGFNILRILSNAQIREEFVPADWVDEL